jgi:hypothetical protein
MPTINHDPVYRAYEIASRAEVTPEQAIANRVAGRRPTLPRPAQKGALPIGLSTWNLWVRTGRAPKPTGNMNGIPVWHLSVIRDYFNLDAADVAATAAAVAAAEQAQAQKK